MTNESWYVLKAVKPCSEGRILAVIFRVSEICQNLSGWIVHNLAPKNVLLVEQAKFQSGLKQLHINC